MKRPSRLVYRLGVTRVNNLPQLARPEPGCSGKPTSPNLISYKFIISAFLDAIASPRMYPCQWVIDSFRFGDSYSIPELCELVQLHSIA